MNKSITDGTIIDVRTNNDYLQGHVENSINLPLENISKVETIISNKDKELYIYCNLGIRSKEAVNYLLKLGYTNVYDVGRTRNIKIKLVE